MINANTPKIYDLEKRTMEFAKRVRLFVRQLDRRLNFFSDIDQLVRASGSVGANYIEANDAISPKDFIHRIKISRKESKESWFWLCLIVTPPSDPIELEKIALSKESLELMNIFGSIIRKCEKYSLPKQSLQ